MCKKLIYLCLSVLVLILATSLVSTAQAEPKNVIFLIGDGMSFEQVKAGGMYANGQAGTLSFELLPYYGELTTYAANAAVTDSAAAGTALATGVKVNNGVISLAYPGDGSELETLLEYFKAQGSSTGLVTTTYMTHATPASFGAHETNRNNNAQIADDYRLQTQPNVLFGGGANGMTVGEFENAGYIVVTDYAGMQALDTETVTMVCGQFGSSHLPYEYDGLGSLPHLSEMTATALSILDNDPDGFFLMVEGGRIDHAGHVDDIRRNTLETVEFSNTVQVAIDWAAGRTDTLILVTADHETGGLTVLNNNGAGEFPTAKWSTTGHTAVNVPVYAWGVNAEMISGIMDNTDMFEVVTAGPEAKGPNPPDGARYEDTWVNLSWRPGTSAASHDVYLGDNFDDVNAIAESTFQGNQTSTFLVVGSPGFAYPDGLVPGTTYYWRIDEVNDTDPNSPWKGSVWSFTVPPKAAWKPDPPNGAKFVDQDAELSWTAGFGAELYYVYFSDNFDDVNTATGRLPQLTTTYTPGTLELDKTYYWRVDESTGGRGAETHIGDVWSFSTIPEITITDPNIIGWWTLDEDSGTTAVDSSGHENNGSLNGTAMSWMPNDGMIGGALSFDGTASGTDYVEISTADISLTAGTVAIWGKLPPDPQLPDTRYFVGHTTIPAWNDRIQLYMDNADTVLDLGLGDSHARQTDIMSLTTETWYHVALTWDGGNYVVYVNGQEKANGSYTGLETLNTVADIGNDGNPGDRTEAFNGLLDDVRIYNVALTGAEISYLAGAN